MVFFGFCFFFVLHRLIYDMKWKRVRYGLVNIYEHLIDFLLKGSVKFVFAFAFDMMQRKLMLNSIRIGISWNSAYQIFQIQRITHRLIQF